MVTGDVENEPVSLEFEFEFEPVHIIWIITMKPSVGLVLSDNKTRFCLYGYQLSNYQRWALFHNLKGTQKS